MGNSVTKDKVVVVVGAGYVGLTVATDLDKNFTVKLIEPQDAYHHKIGALRSAVSPGWEDRLRIPLGAALANGGTVIQQAVQSVTTGEVTLANGSKLSADYIILCHGAGHMLSPLGPREGVTDSASVKAELKTYQEMIAKAQSIVIIGGGPVGCEMAGEILSQHQGKKVTLIESQPALLNHSTPPVIPAAQAKVRAVLERKGCTVHLGLRVDSIPESDGSAFVQGDQSYTLTDGTIVTGDLTFIASGGFKLDAPLLGPEYMDNGKVKVDANLQVTNMKNVFCCGDANNHPETKLGYYGEMQGKHVEKNVIALCKDSPMQPYVGQDAGEFGAMFVPLGPVDGVGAMGTNVLGKTMVRIAKGKGLFFGLKHKQANAVLPDAPGV